MGPKSQQSFKLKVQINIASILVWLLGRSLRFRVIGREQLQCYYGKKGFILNTWHGQQLAGFYFFRGCGYYILSSMHHDGEISSSIMHKLGWRIIRGSSTKGGTRGLIELLRVLRQRAGIVLTPDGPQGPIYHIESGGIYLAHKTGAPLIPLAFVFEHQWISEKSWDKFVIPKPFTRCVVYFGEPLWVTSELTEENLDLEKKRLQDAIHEANRCGEEVLQQWRSGK